MITLRGTAATELFNIPLEDEETIVFGNGGDDTFNVVGEDDEVSRVDVVAGSGNDALNVQFGEGEFEGGAGNDTLDITSGDYEFEGEAGIDILSIGASLSDFSVVSAGSAATIASLGGPEEDDDDDDGGNESTNKLIK